MHGMRRSAVVVAVLTIVALLAGGCPPQQRPLDDFDAAYTVPLDGITVKIINQTDTLLDPEIYTAPAAHGMGALFAPENKRTDFGFGGIGVVLPHDEASISVACGREMMIATLGGIFGDNLGAPTDAGVQAVLQEGLNLQCGALVEFYFIGAGDELRASYAVTP